MPLFSSTISLSNDITNVSKEINKSNFVLSALTSTSTSSLPISNDHTALSSKYLCHYNSKNALSNKLNKTFTKLISKSHENLSTKPPINAENLLKQSSEKYKCELGCSYETKIKRQIELHRTFHQKSFTRRYKCLKCSFHAQNEQTRASHLKHNHWFNLNILFFGLKVIFLIYSTNRN